MFESLGHINYIALLVTRVVLESTLPDLACPCVMSHESFTWKVADNTQNSLLTWIV